MALVDEKCDAPNEDNRGGYSGEKKNQDSGAQDAKASG